MASPRPLEPWHAAQFVAITFLASPIPWTGFFSVLASAGAFQSLWDQADVGPRSVVDTRNAASAMPVWIIVGCLLVHHWSQAASVLAVAAASAAMPAEPAMLTEPAMLAFSLMLTEPAMPMRKAVVPATTIPPVTIPATTPAVSVSIVAVPHGLRHARGQGKTDTDQQQYGPRQCSAVIHCRLRVLTRTRPFHHRHPLLFFGVSPRHAPI